MEKTDNGAETLLSKENTIQLKPKPTTKTGLNHLAKWPPVNIHFENIKYEICDFEGNFFFYLLFHIFFV